MKYLKHTSSGDIYPANLYLAKRDDMVPCNLDGSTDDVEVVEEVKPKRAPRKAKAVAEEVTPEPVEEAEEVEYDDIPDLDLDDL